ncbi:aldehyde dehydrogenase family protein [Nonomuraea sp. B12E4]|uniref:aldehyde dehydrogenase family protein n=1 Tax=Nonomuraea sp. B12E4 TaxID=3153564 RepID=UPI00325C6C48
MTADTMSPGDPATGLVINGETLTTAESIPVHDPSRPDTVVGWTAAATPEDCERAVAAAQRAFTGWSARSATERAELVLAAFEPLAESAAARAELLTRENGKCLQESQIDLAVFEVRSRSAAALAKDFAPVTTLAAPPFATRIHRVPAGVVTLIVPFNWPLAILGASLPYALIAGNTAVVKPPPTAPLAMAETLRVMARELPPGVLNVITGTNDAVQPLLTDPRVQHVVFTGSTAGGRAVMSLASRSLARVTLELGGNDPALLLDDIRLDEGMVGALAGAAFMTTGQVCMAVKRVYVPRSRYSELVEALGVTLDGHRVGGGLDPSTTMGPLNTARQRDLVRHLLEQARAKGAEVREYGSVDEDAVAGGGHYLRPALVLDPAEDLRVVTEEQFGPALPILPYDDLDALVERLNTEWSGLCSSVWSPDLDRAAAVAARLRTGTTWINQANASACDDRAPFGGFRQSGVGREMGQDGLLEFTEPHVVTAPA